MYFEIDSYSLLEFFCVWLSEATRCHRQCPTYHCCTAVAVVFAYMLLRRRSSYSLQPSVSANETMKYSWPQDQHSSPVSSVCLAVQISPGHEPSKRMRCNARTRDGRQMGADRMCAVHARVSVLGGPRALWPPPPPHLEVSKASQPWGLLTGLPE